MGSFQGFIQDSDILSKVAVKQINNSQEFLHSCCRSKNEGKHCSVDITYRDEGMKIPPSLIVVTPLRKSYIICVIDVIHQCQPLETQMC